MTTQIPGTLHALDDTDRTVADPRADVRGRAVVDRDGARLGRIDDLVVDDQAQRVIFLRVAEGGFLGLWATHHLVPVEAVVAIRPDRVVIDEQRGVSEGGPAYDPELAPQPAYYGNVRGWWGVPPSWGAYPS